MNTPIRKTLSRLCARRLSPRRWVGGAVLILLALTVAESPADDIRPETPKNVMLFMVDDLRPQFKAYARAYYGLNGIDSAKTPAMPWNRGAAGDEKKRVMNPWNLKAAVLAIAMATAVAVADAPAERPNVVWMMLEDWTTDLSCYGTRGIDTPNCDRLAEEGARYENAFCTSPVCSPSRSAMMTGFHQNYIGANQHRTTDKKPLPYGIEPLPSMLRDAGYYYTCLMNSKKTDCNFDADLGFEGKDWSGREPGQPFFAQITFERTHRKWRRDPVLPIDPADVELPPYYADTGFVRRDWANGLEQMQVCDREVAAILKRLDEEGMADNTLVFLIGDNGRCHIRGKQFLYDPGLRVPLIVRWPGVLQAGQVRAELVQTIDITATILEVAGVEPPHPLHGRKLYGPGACVRTRCTIPCSCRTVV